MRNLKKDVIFSLFCGELAFWFLIFIIKNPYVQEFRKIQDIGSSLIWLLAIVFPVFYFLGIIVAYFVSKYIKLAFQAVKFLEVGVLNALIDIGILNLLVWIFGITAGIKLAPLNTFSFLAATVNSFLLNRYWTFKKEGEAPTGGFLKFLIVSGTGWGINTGIVVLGTAVFSSSLLFSAGAWVNIVKVLAALIAMTWNFIGYKFIVFKK